MCKELTGKQKKKLEDLMVQYLKVFTDSLVKTELAQHKIEITTKNPVKKGTHYPDIPLVLCIYPEVQNGQCKSHRIGIVPPELPVLY